MPPLFFFFFFCKHYRTYLCGQVSTILFSVIISCFDFSLSLHFYELTKKKKKICIASHHAFGLYLTQLDSISESLRKKLIYTVSRTKSTKMFRCIFTPSYMKVDLQYHLGRNFHSGRTAWNTKEMYCERQQI